MSMCTRCCFNMFQLVGIGGGAWQGVTQGNVRMYMRIPNVYKRIDLGLLGYMCIYILYISTCTHTHTHIYTHVYPYIYIYIYIYTHIFTDTQRSNDISTCISKRFGILGCRRGTRWWRCNARGQHLTQNHAKGEEREGAQMAFTNSN